MRPRPFEHLGEVHGPGQLASQGGGQVRDPAGRRERAILVGVQSRCHPPGPTDDPLDELARLLETAGGVGVSRLHVVQHRHDPATYIGRGKLEALREQVVLAGADLAVFDDELSAAQAGHIEAAIGVRVVDRPALILDIFARRARTREARTQVELARLDYLLPRLTRRWAHLGRQVGGIGVRGEGETQLEIDRRLLRRRILRLRSELRRIDRSRAERRKRRRSAFQVALVGYTNAGKTSLFNLLTGAAGRAEDRLFSTLDPLVRPLGSAGRWPILVIDTVGFVRKLPHPLVASFRSTLREAAQADLLLHVIDPSHADYEQQARTGRQVLADLQLAETPLMEVFTKTDRVDEPGILQRAARLHAEASFVSSETGTGVGALVERIRERALRGTVEDRLVLPAQDPGALVRLRRKADILETIYRDSVVEVRYRVASQGAARARRAALVGERR